MPDAPDKTSAPAPNKQPESTANRLRIGFTLTSPNIWHVYDRVAKEDDERRTKSWDNGLNNLALFAGLFSAVTTAFIIEARQDMEPDYAQLTFLVLNATAFGEKPVHQPFVIPSSSRTVNCLWVASLILSLSAALIAIMGKDWIGMYTARPVCNLRQWAEMRTYRLLCVERWYMSGVIAAAPVLLHVSLVLFGPGLVLFISSDPFTHRLTLGLSLAAGTLYLVTTLSAIVCSASPFKSPATQMIRTALSTVYTSVCSIVSRPEPKLIRRLVCESIASVLRRSDGTTSLPGGLVENVHRYAGLWPGIVAACGATVVYMRKMPSRVCNALNNLQWAPVKSRLHSLILAGRDLSADWFLSSTWTDLPAERRPKLLAETLSWLSSASQAPEVFRAVVFALGDLDIGQKVGEYSSPALRTRLRAEIRRTWQQVDFLTLSRYVLADRNTPGEAALSYIQFTSRFDLSKDSQLRCEDGLAAVIKVDPSDIIPDNIVWYSPDQVAQPRMHEFLLPHIQEPQRYLPDVLILLENRYRTQLRSTNSFSLSSLEARLYQSLDAETRDDYAIAVTVEYGGTAGAIELLTFLCCHEILVEVTIPSAVVLLMDLMESLPFPMGEHRCLAYLFGSRELWYATWEDKHWSFRSLWRLSASLETSCVHPFGPSTVRTLSDDRQFDLALAHTAVMLLSPHNIILKWYRVWIRFLFGHLWQSPSPSFEDNNEELDVIRLILGNAALLNIVGMPDYFHYDDDIISWVTAILGAIINNLGRRLRDPKTIRDGTQLFAALARTEVKGPDDKAWTWDLGEWLRTQAPEAVKNSPSGATVMQGVHDALSDLYPLCEHNRELRSHWDRIGYPGRPGDIFSNPFLDLNVGEFFASAEDPLSGMDEWDEFSDDELMRWLERS